MANRTATFNTSMGTFKIELFEDRAPITTKNFIDLAEKGFYNGVIFHRVIDGFMIQGGDPTGTGRGGPGYDFNDEIHSELMFNRPYLLAMANAGKKFDGSGTNGSQFFITVGPTPHLNTKHTIFGEVADEESRKVVDAIATTRTANERPVQDIVIERVEIERG